MKELTAKLEKIGFSAYESKVFLVLYQGYAMSAADIAKEAKIPRPSVYEILRSFAKKGYCNEIQTPTKQIYEIIDSQVIEDKISKEIYDNYQSKTHALKDCFNDLKPIYKTKRGPEYISDVELIRGFNKHRDQKFLDLVKSSKNAILFMNRLEGNVSSELDKESMNFYKRGGVVKTIYEIEGNFKVKINNKWQQVTREDLIRLCEDFESQGEQIRLSGSVPQILAVFDEKTVFFSLYDESIPKKERSDVIIKNKRFAKFITELFNIYWERSDTIEAFKKLFLNK